MGSLLELDQLRYAAIHKHACCRATLPKLATIIPFCGPTKQVLVKRYHNKGLCANQPLALAGVALAFKSYLWS